MGNIDMAKEEIAYLKLWMGIAIASAISMVAWLVSNFGSAPWLRTLGALAALPLVLFGVLALHRKIEYKIRQLEDL
jgi:hypothetical protein